MKKFLSTIILLGVGIAYSQDDPNALKTKISQLEETITRQERIIKGLKTKLEEQERENKRLFNLCRQNGIETNPKLTRKQQIRSSKIFIDEKFYPPLHIGQVAYLKNGVHILELLNSTTAIARIEITPKSKLIRSTDGGLQRSQETTASQTMCITGIDLTEFTKDSNRQKYIRTLPFEIVGYRNYLNTKMLVLKPYQVYQDSNEPNQ